MMMMMNVLALSLVFTSLVSAGFFTPSPEKQHLKDDDDDDDDDDDVRVKERPMSSGVVIELEKDDGNTKVLISPQAQHHSHDHDKGFVTNAKDKLSDHETMEKIVGKEEEEEENHHKFSPRELVCDAYGKCKHKIARAMGKTKDTAAEKAAEGAKDGVGETIGKVRDAVSDTAKKASDKAQETKESVKDKVKEKASEMKQGSKEQVHNVKDKVYEVKEEAKKGMGEGIGKVKDTVSDAAKKGASTQVGPKEKVKRQVSNVREKAKEWMGTVTGVLHLVGLAAAYGMGVWVTFGSSYVLSGALPNQQFGMVQSKIYPVYFKAMAFSVGMGLLGHLMSGKRMVSPLLSLAAALGMVLVNLLYLEPRATKVMFERMKKEKEKEEGTGKEGPSGGRVVESAAENVDDKGITTEGATQEQQPEKAAVITKCRGVLRGWREILNSYSSVLLLNVLTLMSLTCHLLHLAHHLHTVC